MEDKHNKTFLTAEEAAEYMGITMSYLYKLTHHDTLHPSIREEDIF